MVNDLKVRVTGSRTRLRQEIGKAVQWAEIPLPTDRTKLEVP